MTYHTYNTSIDIFLYGAGGKGAVHLITSDCRPLTFATSQVLQIVYLNDGNGLFLKVSVLPSLAVLPYMSKKPGLLYKRLKFIILNYHITPE